MNKYCLFLADIVTDNMLEEMNTILKENRELLNIELFPIVKMNNTVISKYISNHNSRIFNYNLKELIDYLNYDVEKKTECELFITTIEYYDEIIEDFYRISQHYDSIILPKINQSNILAIKKAYTINCSHHYITQHAETIGNRIKSILENNGKTLP